MFASVPRPNVPTSAAAAGAANVSSQVTSFFDSVKASGTNAMNMVKENSQIQAGAAALKSKATQITDNVSSALKATPIAAVSQQAAAQAESVKGLITGQQKEPETVSEYVDEAMSMSFKNRLIGFGICLASGIFFTALSTLMLPFIVIKPHKFAVAYSLGNLLMLISTFFLVGPKKQCQNMFTGHRAMASAAYFGSLVGTIYAALGLQMYVLVILFIGIQFVSLVWYSLSYIPFGRQIASRLAKPLLRVGTACAGRLCGFCCSRCAPQLLPR